VVNVTERAKDVLRKKLIACGAGPEEGLRLYPSQMGALYIMAGLSEKVEV